MKMKYMGALLLAAAIFAIVWMIDKTGGPDPGKAPEDTAPAERGQLSDYVDPPGLTAHQVALNDLYVEIPYEKQDVTLTKRTIDSEIIVDVADRNSGEVLYTYGESADGKNERHVFREIATKEGKVRLQLSVGIDAAQRQIREVIGTGVVYDPAPVQVNAETIASGSKSGEFPAEKVEVLASLHLQWEGEQENLYEGYVVGVIGE